MDAQSDVVVQRYSRYDLDRQPKFLFCPTRGLLEKVQQHQQATGWVIDREVIIQGGGGPVVFFRSSENWFISLNGKTYPTRDPEYHFKHHRGLLLSEMTVAKSNCLIERLAYLTPWWRLLSDDGSHTDLNFPLEYFLEQWTDRRPPTFE